MTEQPLFHVAEPMILWLLALIPLSYIITRVMRRVPLPGSFGGWAKHVDKHLLPYLTDATPEQRGRISYITHALPFIVWGLLVITLAGPRYDFREADTPNPLQSTMVILDISRSMDADDTPPSRIVRTRQEAEDMLHALDGRAAGLVAFAADAHIIMPLTDDTDALIARLPDISTDLPHIQGSALAPALAESIRALGKDTDASSVILFSDGGFTDNSSALAAAKKIKDNNGHLHVIGIGTENNVILKDNAGNALRNNFGGAVTAPLEEAFLKTLADAGNGIYVRAHYGESDTQAVINAIMQVARSAASSHSGKTRIWEEYFYLVLIPAMLLLLPLWRRGGLAVFLIMLHVSSAQATEEPLLQRYFLNEDQRGLKALKDEHYTDAETLFTTPYNKGIAAYRSGKFSEAEGYFSQDSTPESIYNLGNSLARQGKFEEAVDAYLAVPETSSSYENAAYNLQAVKQALEQQQQQQHDDTSESKQSNESTDQQDQQGNSDRESSPDSTSQDKSSDAEQQPQDSNKNNNIEQPSENNGEEREPNASYQDKPESPASDNTAEEQAQQTEEQDNSVAESQSDAENDYSPSQSSPKSMPSRRDMDADLWLNRMESDTKTFLKNRFYIESLRNNTKQGEQSW